MKYGLYVIFDTVAKESGFPFDAKNDGVAIRKFQNFLREVRKHLKFLMLSLNCEKYVNMIQNHVMYHL